MRFLYSAVFYLLLPLVVIRMLWRSRRAPEYRRRLLERFARFEADIDLARPAIWVHAVSVGEVLASAPLVEHLLQTYPDHRVVLTTTTPTGSERVQALFGGRVLHVYLPWDLPGAMRRFVRRIQPRLLLIMETELWPNMLHYCHVQGCKILLANARLSQRSADGYARFGSFTRQLLAQLDTVACQDQADGQRFLALGLPAAALQVIGSIKFDLQVGDTLRSQAAALRQDFAADNRPILLAASTHAGEDEQILHAFAAVRQSIGNCLLVLVPRHPERFEAVYRLCVDAGWQVVRRSTGPDPGVQDDIVVGDTMGELRLLLGVASVAVIGGSLVEHGGHNALEAAAWGVPVVSGPYMSNFAAISALLSAAGAMIMLDDPARLGACLEDLLRNPLRCQQMGRAGQQVLADNRGAQQRLLALTASLLIPARDH